MGSSVCKCLSMCSRVDLAKECQRLIDGFKCL